MTTVAAALQTLEAKASAPNPTPVRSAPKAIARLRSQWAIATFKGASINMMSMVLIVNILRADFSSLDMDSYEIKFPLIEYY
jgi:hypothetical protein